MSSAKLRGIRSDILGVSIPSLLTRSRRHHLLISERQPAVVFPSGIHDLLGRDFFIPASTTHRPSRGGVFDPGICDDLIFSGSCSLTKP